MVKGLRKPSQIPINTINSIPIGNKTAPKSKQQIDKEHYQKNKERKKQQRKERYQQQKNQEQLTAKQTQSKYYGAEAIKILMSFKEYTELSREKKKLWQNFNWTLKDCQEAVKEELGDITAIMKLEQVANELVRDYWATAKSEEKQKRKSWNVLDYDEQQRVIKYWGRKKANVENSYIDEDERLERQGDSYLKEIERAKFHEERGKVNCKCDWCAYEMGIHEEVEAKIKQEEEKAIKFWEAKEPKEKKEIREKDYCMGCEELRLLSEEGYCRKCESENDI